MKDVDFSVRELLSTEGQNIFDDVAYQRVLGASTHIRLISEMILDLCSVAQSKKERGDRVLKDVGRLITFFKNTRGEASQAISNALDLMMFGINEKANADPQIIIYRIQKGIADFHKTNTENLDKINIYATSLLTEMDKVLLFDYSSTVGRMIETAKNKLTVFLPESRILNGGKPYIEKCFIGKHAVHFIPDGALLYYLKECDGVFIGSETLYPDGRVFNTIGSEMVAKLCMDLGVPFYVLTTLLKIDMRPLTGYQKPPVIVDVKQKFSDVLNIESLDSVDFSCPELVEIPVKYISALVTEKGVVPTTAIFQLAMEYVTSIRGI